MEGYDGFGVLEVGGGSLVGEAEDKCLKYGARRHEIYDHGWTGFILKMTMAAAYAMAFYIFFFSNFFRLRVIYNLTFSSKPTITSLTALLPHDASLVDYSATSDLDLQEFNPN